MGHRRRVHAPQHRQLPTKSGVIGLVASALGRARGSDISDLAALRFGVQPVHTGPRLTDFQTMGKRADGKPNPLETKEYLQDSTFTVGLESTDLRLLIRIGAAIQHPVYMPYLGRRACPPAGPIRVGLVDKPLEQAFKGKERIHVETVDGVEAHWINRPTTECSRHATPMPSTRYSMR